MEAMTTEQLEAMRVYEAAQDDAADAQRAKFEAQIQAALEAEDRRMMARTPAQVATDRAWASWQRHGDDR